MARVLFDVTRLLQTGLHTGIQRVVRRLLGAAQQRLVPAGCEVWPVVFEADQWRALPALSPHPMEGRGSAPQAQGRPLQPRAGDALLLFDASWYLDPWRAVDAALARGASLYGMVHDLLPLDHPEWFRPALNARFSAHLRELASRASRLFTPSRVTASRLQRWCGHHGASTRICVLPHGGNFADDGPAVSPAGAKGSPLPAELASVFAARRPAAPLFVVLGTLEPRKGHALVLDAFDALWGQGGQQQLLFVGSAGWCVDGLLARIVAHPQRERLFFHRAGVDDRALAHCLRQADGLIHFARDEGFGLPILEAAMQGCPVIASDIPVLREVGGDWPCYVPHADTAALIDAIGNLRRERSASPPVRTWSEVADALGALLMHDLQTAPHQTV